MIFHFSCRNRGVLDMPREIIEISRKYFLSSFVKIKNLHSSLSQLEVYQLFILLVVDAKLHVRQNHDPKTRRGIEI